MTDRGPNGRFLKGTSGNPGGRKRDELSITALIDEAISKEDWLFIFGHLRTKARRGDLKAIEMLLDRRFGKAIQSTELSTPPDKELTVHIVTDEGKSEGA